MAFYLGALRGPMTQPFADAVVEVRLHSGDPGAAGTANAITDATAAIEWILDENDFLDTAEPVDIPLPEGETATWMSGWDSEGEFTGARWTIPSRTATDDNTVVRVSAADLGLPDSV